MRTTRTNLRVLAVATLFEIAVYALFVVVPGKQEWLVVFTPVLVLGGVLHFQMGGGMSMVDGLSPGWRIDLAAILGFVVDTAVMYGVCLVVTKLVREIRPVFRLGPVP